MQPAPEGNRSVIFLKFDDDKNFTLFRKVECSSIITLGDLMSNYDVSAVRQCNASGEVEPRSLVMQSPLDVLRRGQYYIAQRRVQQQQQGQKAAFMLHSSQIPSTEYVQQCRGSATMIDEVLNDNSTSSSVSSSVSAADLRTSTYNEVCSSVSVAGEKHTRDEENTTTTTTTIAEDNGNKTYPSSSSYDTPRTFTTVVSTEKNQGNNNGNNNNKNTNSNNKDKPRFVSFHEKVTVTEYSLPNSFESSFTSSSHSSLSLSSANKNNNNSHITTTTLSLLPPPSTNMSKELKISTLEAPRLLGRPLSDLTNLETSGNTTNTSSSSSNNLSVPTATIISVPMYVSAIDGQVVSDEVALRWFHFGREQRILLEKKNADTMRILRDGKALLDKYMADEEEYYTNKDINALDLIKLFEKWRQEVSATSREIEEGRKEMAALQVRYDEVKVKADKSRAEVTRSLAEYKKKFQQQQQQQTKGKK